jgi:hypothetical protein
MNQEHQQDRLEQNEELAELRADTSLTKTQMGIDSKRFDFGRNFKKK